MTLTSPWRCAHCGGEAVYVGPSLDPAHPLGRCLDLEDRYTAAMMAYQARRPGSKLRRPKHPDMVPLVRSRDEAAELHSHRRAREARRRHNLYHTDRLVRGCPACDELHQALFSRRASDATP